MIPAMAGSAPTVASTCPNDASGRPVSTGLLCKVSGGKSLPRCACVSGESEGTATPDDRSRSVISSPGPCAGYLGHPFRKRNLERDLLVPFCLQERGGKG